MQCLPNISKYLLFGLSFSLLCLSLSGLCLSLLCLSMSLFRLSFSLSCPSFFLLRPSFSLLGFSSARSLIFWALSLAFKQASSSRLFGSASSFGFYKIQNPCHVFVERNGHGVQSVQDFGIYVLETVPLQRHKFKKKAKNTKQQSTA